MTNWTDVRVVNYEGEKTKRVDGDQFYRVPSWSLIEARSSDEDERINVNDT
jgi:hypothetical protein